MRIFYTIIITLILTVSSSFAACTGNRCADVKITGLYISEGNTLIETSGTETGLSNCVPTSNKYIRLFNTHSNHDKIYSALLAAYKLELNMRLRTYDTPGNTGECSIEYAVLEPE